jgi:hypothetical protein
LQPAYVGRPFACQEGMLLSWIEMGKTGYMLHWITHCVPVFLNPLSQGAYA